MCECIWGGNRMLFIRALLAKLAASAGLVVLIASSAPGSETYDVPDRTANRVAISSPALVAGNYVLDKRASKMEFCVTHFPLSEVHGTFAFFDGGFQIPTTSLECSQVNVMLAAASVDTRSRIIDKMVTGEDFFDVQRHPEIRFVSTGIHLIGKGRARLDGDLTLLGVMRPVSFSVKYAFEEFDPEAKQRKMTFYATGEISRSDFGMEGLPGVVSDKVKICMRGIGTRLVGDDASLSRP